MKIQKFTLGLSILACSFILFSCGKKVPNKEPVADTEIQSSVDAVWATYVIADMAQICGFMGEGYDLQHFYTPSSISTGTFTPVRDLANDQLVFSWNQTHCIDGRLRDGSIFLFSKKDPISNPDANDNSRYYRDFGFVGRIQLSNYKVDGWQVALFSNAPAYIYNKTAPFTYDPSKVQLTWRVAGKFLLTHPTDPTKNIVWDGELYKTLTNSTDKDIFPINKQDEIRWVSTVGNVKKGAIVHYHGRVSGMTSANIPFEMTIDSRTPLVRDLLCSSDPVATVAAAAGTGSNSVAIEREEHHPFIGGVASFTTGDAYPRQIFFGNEDNTEKTCDNKGIVRIKGISYKVDFRK